jgi:uncharacterized repeat protein (TIGR03803 family)
MKLKILAFAVAFTLATNLSAQTFTTLHSFTFGSDGANSEAGLILSGNTLYGTASGGGNSGYGTVFKVNTDGLGFTTLHSFSVVSYYTDWTNSDGAIPFAGLVLAGNTLYGTATRGGANGGSPGGGTVFCINTDGSGFKVLHNFTVNDGFEPNANLILSGNTLYGTTWQGGSSGYGTVFKVNTDGSDFTNLHSFTVITYNPTINSSTNSDGASPMAALILSGNTLYGTAYEGGSLGYGTVFSVNTDGSHFTTLHNFPTRTPNNPNDGAYPKASLVLAGNTLYGTTYYGGSSDWGTVFAVNTDGTDFTNLHSFTGSDGANPDAGLTLSSNTLYGTAYDGSRVSPYGGTIFNLD